MALGRTSGAKKTAGKVPELDAGELASMPGQQFWVGVGGCPEKGPLESRVASTWPFSTRSKPKSGASPNSCPRSSQTK